VRSALSLVAGIVALASLAGAPARALTDLGAFPTSPNAGSVFADGAKVYAAVGLGGIRILDVSNPAAPSLLGQFDTVGQAREVVAQGILAYVVQSDGLQILDVSNPAAPAPLGFLPLVSLEGIAVSGSFAYVAKALDGLVVVDVSNPAAPVVRGSVPSAGAHRVAVVGTTVYLVDNQDGALLVIDAADPDAPVVRGSVVEGIPANLGDVSVRRGRAYLTSSSGVRVYDVTDPTKPILADVVGTENTTALALQGGLLFSRATGGVVRAFDVADSIPGAPAASLWLGTHEAAGGQIVGSLAYVANAVNGLSIVDLTNPLVPAVVGSFPTPGGAAAVRVVGNRAYVSDGASGLKILDVTNPASPSQLGVYNSPGYASDVVLQGNYAFVADGPEGVRVVDVSNSSAPVNAGWIDLGGYSQHLELANGVLYVSGSGLNLTPVDVHTPTAPVVLPPFAVAGGGSARFVTVVNALAFTSGYDKFGVSAFRVFNVSNPSSAQQLAAIPLVQCNQPGKPVVLGQRVYVGACGISVIDISKPRTPVVVTTLSQGLFGYQYPGVIGFRGSYLVTSQLAVADVSHLGAGPDELAATTISGTGGVASFSAQKKLLVLAQGAGGVRLLDASAEMAARPCANGLDDDADLQADVPDDLGCSSSADVSELPECADGIDNDGDGDIDKPADFGCANAIAGSKEDPQCFNGVDDDGDGATDYPADTLCPIAYDDDENGGTAPMGCGLLGLEPLVMLAVVRRLRRRGHVGGALPPA
jgi:hypothetical protein